MKDIFQSKKTKSNQKKVTFRSSFRYLSRKLSAECGYCTTTDELCYNKLNAGSDRKDFILQVYILSKLLRPTWPPLVILHAHDAIQKYNAILNQMFTVQHCTTFSSLDLVPFSTSFFRLAPQVTIFMSFWCAVEILLTSTFRQKKNKKSNIVWTSMLSRQRSSFGHEKITSILSHENDVWINYLRMTLKPRLILFIKKIYKTLP
jgi:hypothetical protein